MRLVDKLKHGLAKTKRLLGTDIRDLFKSEGRLVDEAFLDDLFATLLKTGMGVTAAQLIVDEIRSTFRARVVQVQWVLERINNVLDRLTRNQPPHK
jgi:fused signal recognition particle receptor